MERKQAGWTCYFGWLIRLGGHLRDGKKATLRCPGQHVGLLRTYRSPEELEPKVSKGENDEQWRQRKDRSRAYKTEGQG